jgi:hypothetical protein
MLSYLQKDELSKMIKCFIDNVPVTITSVEIQTDSVDVNINVRSLERVTAKPFNVEDCPLPTLKKLLVIKSENKSNPTLVFDCFSYKRKGEDTEKLHWICMLNRKHLDEMDFSPDCWFKLIDF